MRPTDALPDSTEVRRYTFWCPHCRVPGSTYLGGAMMCLGGHGMYPTGTQVLVLQPSGRRVWKRSWDARKGERVFTWGELRSKALSM